MKYYHESSIKLPILHNYIFIILYRSTLYKYIRAVVYIRIFFFDHNIIPSLLTAKSFYKIKKININGVTLLVNRNADDKWF